MNQLTVNKLKEETKTLDLFTSGRRRRYTLPCPNFFWIFSLQEEKCEGKQMKDGKWKIIFIETKGCVDK